MVYFQREPGNADDLRQPIETRALFAEYLPITELEGPCRLLPLASKAMTCYTKSQWPSSPASSRLVRESNQVNFREIPSYVLEKVCQYFTYKIKYTNSSQEIPDFPIAPEIALELLMAAKFLDC